VAITEWQTPWEATGVKLRFDREPVSNPGELLTRYSADEFTSATRSTVPLLSLLRHGGEVWREILAELEMPEQDTVVHLEYTVRSPQGRGKPSHTDAMLIAGNRACAIEAKWTEPPYATVQKWLGAEPYSSNKLAVLNGWLSLLQPHATRDLRPNEILNVTYQTLHRAASACAVGNSSALAYLVFTPDSSGIPTDVAHLWDGLARLSTALGSPAGFPLRLIEVEIRPTLPFARISRLPKGNSDTGASVRDALHGPPLFDFVGFHIQHVTQPDQGTSGFPLSRP
jgi:hypothetical protein